LRIAFPPYDFLILISTTFLLGIFLKRIFLKNQIYQKGIDKLFPYAVAYIPVSIIFIYVFEEFPVKFFLYDNFYPIKNSKSSPQTIQIDDRLLFALVYNCLIWLFCLIVIIRHFVKKRKPFYAK